MASAGPISIFSGTPTITIAKLNWFPNDPLFHVSPWVFGCTCFVHNVPPDLDKLSSREVYLMVYVDDIVITRNDATRIFQLKEHLFSHFQTKDLGCLKYFLGIEVAQSKKGVVISQRKYALDILKESGLKNCRTTYMLLGFSLYVPNLVHTTYMFKLEGEC
uniref:Reverse transcriptase Ty1/copia-type domain-containing protein n=1 Tax=Cajanus cajan TaxID=3821 RepID=A0A151QX71_CAJCA|nr:hypothetical protein KK1_044078 [Cajanus cajan]